MDDWLTSPLSKIVTHFTEKNKEVFNNIFSQKCQVMGRLKGVQASIEIQCTNGLLKLKKRLLMELEETLDLEELFWWHKSSPWGSQYKIFLWPYNFPMGSKQIVLVEDKWGLDDISSHTIEFFRNLYTNEGLLQGTFPIWGKFPLRTDVDQARLSRKVMTEEVRYALFYMAPLQALGIDGLNAQFFQLQWKLFGPSIVSWVMNVFGGGSINPFFNKTLLVLILKSSSPEEISQFRPINLCLIISKVLTKDYAYALLTETDKFCGRAKYYY
ncbi:reverse transcriptase [Gossypium australe]|uniref:Reverse transcriptase n=1 Tax=Gossypium australe TaxID=47621 RepID=A0A5B6W2D2_9ROSI|nr:reverse transcriptase [Gossypium australe]